MNSFVVGSSLFDVNPLVGTQWEDFSGYLVLVHELIGLLRGLDGFVLLLLGFVSNL